MQRTTCLKGKILFRGNTGIKKPTFAMSTPDTEDSLFNLVLKLDPRTVLHVFLVSFACVLLEIINPDVIAKFPLS